MDDQLQIIIKDQNVAEENAKQLIKAFGAPFTEAGEILTTYKDIVVTNINDKDLMAQAKTKRLALKKIRTSVENKRKELKEDSLRTGKAIDSVAKYIKENIQPAEEYLELQEKYAEIEEAKLRAELKDERAQKLGKYTDDPYAYNLDIMDYDQFEKVLAGAKASYELKKAQEEAYQREQVRIAEEKAAEDKRIREENEKLRKEAELAELERQKLLRVQQEKEAAIQKELEAERMKVAEAERKQREEKEAFIAAEEKKIQLERQAKQEQEAKELAELQAPDKDKIMSFKNALETIRKEKLPAVKTNEAQKIVTLIDEMLLKMQKVIVEKVEEL